MSKSGKNHNLTGYYSRQKDRTIKNKLRRRLKREKNHEYWTKNEEYQAKQAERDKKLGRKETTRE